jgi:hypothetical protein
VASEEVLGSTELAGRSVGISGSVRSPLMMMLHPSMPPMQRYVTVCAVTDKTLIFNACIKTNI